jgi:hypothetical protein
MDFNQIVRNALFESPDTIKFEDEYYAYDEKEGNPITFIVDDLLIVPDHLNPWNKTKDEINSFDSKLGLCVVAKDIGEEGKHATSHTNFFELLGHLEFDFNSLKELGVKFFSPDKDLDGYFEQLEKKYPNFTVYTKFNIETADHYKLGRMWKIKDKVVISIWDTQQEVLDKYIIPFAKSVYPNVPEDDILIESPLEDGYYKASSTAEVKELQPHEKEIVELIKQLHMSTGPAKEKIRVQLKELLTKHGLDPKKYGISDEVLKGSQLTAQKVLGPKDTMASLKARTQTSESFKDFFKA